MSETMFNVYTDGACKGNPGPGGWAAVILSHDIVLDEISGYEEMSTNNRMELVAIIQALRYFTSESKISVYTDSVYVKNGITVWIKIWLKNGWLTASKKPVKNEDLWRELLCLSKQHHVQWYWVKGHADSQYNIRADNAANLAIQALRKM